MGASERQWVKSYASGGGGRCNSLVQSLVVMRYIVEDKVTPYDISRVVVEMVVGLRICVLVV